MCDCNNTWSKTRQVILCPHNVASFRYEDNNNNRVLMSCTTQFWPHQILLIWRGVWVTSKCSTRTRLFNRACRAAIIDRVTRGVQSVTASQAHVPGVTRGTITLAVIDGRECSPCLPRERKHVKGSSSRACSHISSLVAVEGIWMTHSGNSAEKNDDAWEALGGIGGILPQTGLWPCCPISRHRTRSGSDACQSMKQASDNELRKMIRRNTSRQPCMTNSRSMSARASAPHDHAVAHVSHI